MEAELSELRWHAENGTQGVDGGPRRASTPPHLAAFDAVAYNRHAMSEGAQVERRREKKREGERRREKKRGVREIEGTYGMQRAVGYETYPCVGSRPLVYRYWYQNFEGGCDADLGA